MLTLSQISLLTKIDFPVYYKVPQKNKSKEAILEKPFSLANRISNERDMEAVRQLCDEVHSEVFLLNKKGLMNEPSDEKILKEKCLLLKFALARHGIEEKFENEDLCKLAYEVFEIKLLRAA